MATAMTIDGGGPSPSISEEALATGETPRKPLLQGEGGIAQHRHGLDAGLARSCPGSCGLSQTTSRFFRRRIDVFERCCSMRGQNAVAEGAFLLLQTFTKDPWDACEAIDLNDIESPQAFGFIKKSLDNLYQYDDTVEILSSAKSCSRSSAAATTRRSTTYILRHQHMMANMREVHLPVPEAMAGWHLLTLSAIPKWLEPTVRAAISHQLTVHAATERLKMMFGADSLPNPKDIAGMQKALRGTSGADALTMEDEWDEWHDAYDDGGSYGGYEDDAFCVDDWYDYAEYGDDYYEDAYNYDDDIPLELEEAAGACEEAYVNYTDCRNICASWRMLAASTLWSPSRQTSCAEAAAAEARVPLKAKPRAKAVDAAAREAKGKAVRAARRFTLALKEEAREPARRYRRRAAPHNSLAHASSDDATVDRRQPQDEKAMIDMTLDTTTGSCARTSRRRTTHPRTSLTRTRTSSRWKQARASRTAVRRSQ